MKTRFLALTVGAALQLSTAATAQVQQQGDIFGQLLGAMFGTSQQTSEQVLENDWSNGRRPFEQRREQLDLRIDSAVRDGSLSRSEASQMRGEYNDIVGLEAQYSADGPMSQEQRSVLRSRYRALSQRISGPAYDRNDDRDDGRWQPLSTQNAMFDRRVADGLRDRSLTSADAARLRAEWRSLAQTEARYRYNGIDAREQADLWTRYNAIDIRLNASGDPGFGADRNTARWSQMETRLATAERNGRVSSNDALLMRTQMSDLVRLDRAYASGGYSAEQRAYLARRYADLDGVLGYNRR